MATFSSGTTRFCYPANVGSPPFDKWMLFEAKRGRHVVRDQVVGENGATLDETLASTALYLTPSALYDQLAVNYEENDLGPFVGAAVEYFAQTGSQMFNFRFGRDEMPSGGITGILSAIGGKVAQAAGSIDLKQIGDPLKDAIAADVFKGIDALTGGGAGVIAGQKPNPRTDVIFDAQQYRSHQFEFMLVPRDLGEAKAIDAIIRFFQFYMLPSYRDSAATQQAQIGAFMIGFPYEFEISICGPDGNQLEHVNKIGRSVLRNITVDHAGGGKSAFVKQNGEYYPVATKMTVQFQEVRLLDRKSDQIKRPTPELADPRA